MSETRLVRHITIDLPLIEKKESQTQDIRLTPLEELSNFYYYDLYDYISELQLDDATISWIRKELRKRWKVPITFGLWTFLPKPITEEPYCSDFYEVVKAAIKAESQLKEEQLVKDKSLPQTNAHALIKNIIKSNSLAYINKAQNMSERNYLNGRATFGYGSGYHDK